MVGWHHGLDGLDGHEFEQAPGFGDGQQLFVTLWAVYPARLLYPWHFPGKNSGVGCRFLL